MSSAVAEEQDEAPLMIDEIPDELVAVSERYEVGLNIICCFYLL